MTVSHNPPAFLFDLDGTLLEGKWLSSFHDRFLHRWSNFYRMHRMHSLKIALVLQRFHRCSTRFENSVSQFR